MFNVIKNNIKLFFTYMENYIGGKPSNNDQTKIINSIIDMVESWDEEKRNKNIHIDPYTLCVKIPDGDYVSIWISNRYYSCGNFYGYSYNDKKVNVNLPEDIYPNIRTRIRLCELADRIKRERNSQFVKTLGDIRWE